MKTTDFRRRVLAAVTRIPAGRVATYGDIAAVAGNPRASRAVGNIMRECHSPAVPCHRVIAAGGNLGGFGSSPQLKKDLLRAEGVLVVGSRIREFERRRWPRKATADTEGHGKHGKHGGPRKTRSTRNSWETREHGTGRQTSVRRRATRWPDGDV